MSYGLSVVLVSFYANIFWGIVIPEAQHDRSCIYEIITKETSNDDGMTCIEYLWFLTCMLWC